MKTLIPVLVVLAACADTIAPPPCVCVNPLLDSTASVTISRVIDGDTYEFFAASDAIQIRLLSVDCFESRRGSRLNEQADSAGISVDSALSLGVKGKEFAAAILTGKQVIIRRNYQEANFDNFGRLLRYVRIGAVELSDTLRNAGLTVE